MQENQKAERKYWNGQLIRLKLRIEYWTIRIFQLDN